jgi:hypothetical protein
MADQNTMGPCSIFTLDLRKQLVGDEAKKSLGTAVIIAGVRWVHVAPAVSVDHADNQNLRNSIVFCQ